MTELMSDRYSEKANGSGRRELDTKAALDAPFRFYEFFAGAGMARMGLGNDWECVWANDNDARKREIYEHNFGSTHFDARDVFDVAEEIGSESADKSTSPSFPRNVDMAWASFPCQDLSLAGWQRGMSAKRSGAYWPFWRIMRSLYDQGQRPPVLVIENVVGLLSGGGFRGLCESLAALNMNFGALVVDAKHFIPQSRPGVFVVAADASLDLLGLVGSKPVRSTWHPKSVLEAERTLPEALKKRWAWWKLKDAPQTVPSISEVFEIEPADTRYHTASETERLVSLMAPLHLQRLDEAKKAGATRVGFLYKRTRNGAQRAEVRFDGLAGCLRTPKGGSSRQTVVVVRDSQVRTRLLSRIEAARLMGIPLSSNGGLPGAERDFFPEHFSYNDAYMAMGDGVAVPVVRHLAKSLLNPVALRARRAKSSGPRKSRDSSPSKTDADDFLASVDQHIARWTATRR